MILDTFYKLSLQEPLPAFQISGFYTVFNNYWKKDFSFAGEQHNCWELILIEDGQVEITEDDQVYVLQGGDMILHAPMEFHKIRSAGQTMPHLFILSFAAKGNMPTVLTDGVFHLSGPEQDILTEAIRNIFRFFDNSFLFKDREKEIAEHLLEEKFKGFTHLTPEQSGQLGASSLSLFLLQLSMKERGTNTDAQKNSKQALEYQRVVKAMQNGLYQNLSLTEISTACDISISYIKRLFMRYAGMSPKSYYIQMRVREALRLLRKGHTAEETAALMNFSSPNYFSIFMKKHLGLPPAEYIRKNTI
ncbi:MAG: helix-turn-helix transcriptional regulator [Clostridia bacterium]|nr:helix-turn-helix transcriptional regulator [Clostridia bacterium]